MTRTVRDLVEAIRPDEQYSFDVDAVWRGSVRRAHRRTVRRRSAIAVAVATVAAMVLPLAVMGLRSAGPPPGRSGPSTGTAAPTPTRPVLSATLRAAVSGAWVISPAATGERVQIAYVRRVDQTKVSGSVEVYDPGAFDPTPVLVGTPTTVDGATAYFVRTENPFSGNESGQHRTVEPTIAWRYAPDAWAVVRGTFDDDGVPSAVPTGLRRVASAVEIGAPAAVRLPFRVGFRPPGLTPVTVLTYEASGLRRMVEYDYATGPHDWRDPYRSLYLPLRIGMVPARPERWNPNTIVGGRPAMRNGDNEVVVTHDDRWLVIGSGPHAPTLSTDELERIYAGLTFADWIDQTTWFDAGTAA